MQPDELIELIESAEDKDALESIGQKHLAYEVNRRQGLETIRGQLIELAEDRTESETAGADEASAEDDEGEDSTTGDYSITQNSENPEAGDYPERIEVPEDDSEPEDTDTGSSRHRGNRLLRNTVNGRVFVWTAALAKRADMQEVSD